MTKSQVKKLCKDLHKGKFYLENFYLIKYLDGWKIGTPQEFSTSNKRALDMELYSL